MIRTSACICSSGTVDRGMFSVVQQLRKDLPHPSPHPPFFSLLIGKDFGFSDKCFSHSQTRSLCLETGTVLFSRPSDKPATLRRGKSTLAEVGVYQLWSISRAALPHLVIRVLRCIFLGGRRAFGLVPKL